LLNLKDSIIHFSHSLPAKMRAVAALSAAALVGAAYATTGETVTVSSLQVTAVNADDGVGAGADLYTYYTGDGSTGAGWPAQSNWVSFSDMYALI
jgi:hypothetical protein